MTESCGKPMSAPPDDCGVRVEGCEDITAGSLLLIDGPTSVCLRPHASHTLCAVEAFAEAIRKLVREAREKGWADRVEFSEATTDFDVGKADGYRRGLARARALAQTCISGVVEPHDGAQADDGIELFIERLDAIKDGG